MKISQLIEKLEKIKKEEGDLLVYCFSKDYKPVLYGNKIEVRKIILIKEKGSLTEDFEEPWDLVDKTRSKNRFLTKKKVIRI